MSKNKTLVQKADAPTPANKTTKSKAGQVRTEYHVSAERFIQVWQSSESADQVGKTLDMPVPIVHARASTYRKAGIKLKSMPRRHRRGLDVEALNTLIETMGGEQESGASPSPPKKRPAVAAGKRKGGDVRAALKTLMGALGEEG